MANLNVNGTEKQVEIVTRHFTLKNASVTDNFCYGVAFGTSNSNVRLEFQLQLSGRGCEVEFRLYDRSGGQAVKDLSRKTAIRITNSISEQIKLMFELVAANHL